MKDLIVAALSLALGAIVLLPAIVGQLVRPLMWPFLVPVFVGVAFASIACLLVARLLEAWGDDWRSRAHKWHGWGNWLTVGSLVVLGALIVLNYWDDLYAAPRVLNVKVNPVAPEPGKVVEVDLDVLNPSGRPLAYAWTFDGKPVPGLRTAYIRMPDTPGKYQVTASLSVIQESRILDATTAVTGDTLDAPLVKVWLDVVAKEPAPTASAPAAPQTIVQICHGGKDGQQKRRPSPGTRCQPTAASAATADCGQRGASAPGGCPAAR